MRPIITLFAIVFAGALADQHVHVHHAQQGTHLHVAPVSSEGDTLQCSCGGPDCGGTVNGDVDFPCPVVSLPKP
ncbi:unnamed protein product [Zymoseptoria tritici ST99CH_1A5]|uniref:Post-SET domain-containing protein n=3 Tax=Zymoseptoria tritici TaxID=1047171 RepID=A0A1X7RI46_ZYMT9|nr:unnamed protein product [Zymoseptoria tritici ST99CH_3D7]SMR45629.1 unnamed protein product [Zymoseptoria tritici ST99CH_1E4]SMY20786.1 unnamed protein product [Zymoseptoria tritici ST99CH_1A5]